MKDLNTKLLRLYWPKDLPWRMKKTAEAISNWLWWWK